jgi:hypothetical protein
MASQTDDALGLAQQSLTRRLAEAVNLDEAGYCQRPEDNLVATVGPGVWRRARRDLERGKGDELATKFRAPHSSSALAVNTFAQLVDGVDLPLGSRIEGGIAFEQQRSAWAGGYWPTLDLIVETPGAPVRLFVESKCTEFLRQGAADFSEAFLRHAKERLGQRAVETFDLLTTDAEAFDPLDARQLAKHFLAAKRSVVGSPETSKVVLLCVWWEPADAYQFQVFARHREAVHAFGEALPDDDVQVLGLSYRDLWTHWEDLGDPVLKRHVDALRQRYDVSLRPPGASS